MTVNTNSTNKESIQNYKNCFIIIIGIDKFINKISDNNKTKITELLEQCKKIKKVNFLIVDSIDNQKNTIYNQKYRNIVKNNKYIWYGNGISEQYTVKTPYNMRDKLPENFGYVVNKNIVHTVKLLVEEENE